MATKTIGGSKKPAEKKKPSTRPKKSASKEIVKREQKGGNRKHNWESIKKQFVEGYPVKVEEPDGDRDWPNMRELSERVGVKYDQVRARASKERWAELRSAHQVAIARERQERRKERLGTEAIQFDEKNLDIAKLGLRLVHIRMGEILRGVSLKEAIRRQAEEDLKNGLPIDWKALSSFIRADELNALAKTAEILQGIGMKALGTDVDRHVLEVSGQVEHAVSVGEELQRDDVDRLAAFVAATNRAGLLDFMQLNPAEEDEDADSPTMDGDDGDEIVDAEIVDE